MDLTPTMEYRYTYYMARDKFVGLLWRVDKDGGKIECLIPKKSYSKREPSICTLPVIKADADEVTEFAAMRLAPNGFPDNRGSIRPIKRPSTD